MAAVLAKTKTLEIFVRSGNSGSTLSRTPKYSMTVLYTNNIFFNKMPCLISDVTELTRFIYRLSSNVLRQQGQEKKVNV